MKPHVTVLSDPLASLTKQKLSPKPSVLGVDLSFLSFIIFSKSLEASYPVWTRASCISVPLFLPVFHIHFLFLRTSLFVLDASSFLRHSFIFFFQPNSPPPPTPRPDPPGIFTLWEG